MRSLVSIAAGCQQHGACGKTLTHPRRSFEGAIAALGAPLVGAIAQDWFNYDTIDETGACKDGKPQDQDVSRDHGNAGALGDAMLVCMLVPWALCLLIYTFLHWTYPRDKVSAQPQPMLTRNGLSRVSTFSQQSQLSL